MTEEQAIEADKISIAMGLYERWNTRRWDQATQNAREEYLDWADDIMIFLRNPPEQARLWISEKKAEQRAEAKKTRRRAA